MNTELLETDKDVIEEPTMEPGLFPVDALSPAMRDIAESLSDVYQIPTSMPGMATLAVHSAAIGKAYKLTGAVNGQSSYGNLYVIASAGRGEGKGSVAAVIAKPLIKASAELQRNFVPIKAQREAEAEMLKTEISALLKKVAKHPASRDEFLTKIAAAKMRLEEIQPGGRPIQAPTYHEGNCTSEALTASLCTHDQAVLSFSPEAGDLLRVALGKYAKGNQADFDLLLSGWSTECCTNNRVSSGRVHLVPTIAALWFAQPIILQELLANEEAFERGLTARVLIFNSNNELTYDDGCRRTINPSALENWHGTINHTLGIRARGSLDLVVQCEPAAKEVFREFHNHGIDRRRGDCSDVAGELSRWRENAIRVALNLWVADGDGGDLTAAQAKRAVEIVQWCGLSYLSILRSGRAAQMLGRATQLREVLLGYPGKSVTLRDLTNRHSFPQDEVRRLATGFPELLELVNKGPSEKGGRRSELVRIPTFN